MDLCHNSSNPGGRFIFTLVECELWTSTSVPTLCLQDMEFWIYDLDFELQSYYL